MYYYTLIQQHTISKIWFFLIVIMYVYPYESCANVGTKRNGTERHQSIVRNRIFNSSTVSIQFGITIVVVVVTARGFHTIQPIIVEYHSFSLSCIVMPILHAIIVPLVHQHTCGQCWNVSLYFFLRMMLLLRNFWFPSNLKLLKKLESESGVVDYIVRLSFVFDVVKSLRCCYVNSCHKYA